MTQHKFNNLDFTLQALYLVLKGRFISNRFQDGIIISLYALDNFFVESYYNTQAGEVERIDVVQENLVLG